MSTAIGAVENSEPTLSGIFGRKKSSGAHKTTSFVFCCSTGLSLVLRLPRFFPSMTWLRMNRRVVASTFFTSVALMKGSKATSNTQPDSFTSVLQRRPISLTSRCHRMKVLSPEIVCRKQNTIVHACEPRGLILRLSSPGVQASGFQERDCYLLAV